MAKESDLQQKITKWLRSQKCFVWKMQQNATTQAGVSDLFFCKGPVYGFIECKKSMSSPFRVGQKEFLERIGRYAYAERICPENWEEEKQKLEDILSRAEEDIEKIKKNGRCSVAGCMKPARSFKKGLCAAHEYQVRTHGVITSTKLKINTDRKKHPLYSVWHSMLGRCNDKNNKYYGGKGVQVCDRWVEKNAGFYNFLDDMGEPHNDQYTLDRIDPNGPYSPENCRWVDRHIQGINQNRSRKDGLNNITPYSTKAGTHWLVHLHRGKEHFRKAFDNLNDAIEYRDEMEKKIWK